MAYEWLVTADWHEEDVFTSINASDLTRSNTTARTGTYSFRTQGSENASMGVVSNATKYLGIGFYTTTAANAGAVRIKFRESTTNHVSIVGNTASGAIEVRRGDWNGTLLGSGGSITDNRWYFLGIKVTVHDSTGIVTVNLDGTEIIALTSQDTRNGATGVIDNIMIGAATNYVYYDDIKVRDDAIPGVGGLYVYVPTGDGADTGWTASAGNRWACVDEAPATYADYISTDVATLNTKSTFTHAAMAAAAYDSIDCVCAAAVAKLDGAGSGNIRAIMESNGSYGSGDAVALSTTTKYVHLFRTTDPDGDAAWTKTAVGAAEPGVETI